MYEEHTEHYDKDEVVAPTRRHLCSELTGGLSNSTDCGQQTPAAQIELRIQLNVAETR